jgi:hypothetical protein
MQSNLYKRIDFANLDSSRGTQKRPEGSFISNTSMLAECYITMSPGAFRDYYSPVRKRAKCNAGACVYDVARGAKLTNRFNSPSMRRN